MPGTPSSGRPSDRTQCEVRGPQTPPTMPDDLTGEHAKELWRLAVESLPHVLRPIDFAILKQCCQAFEAGQRHQAKGETKLALASFRLFENHAKQIGLTPSSRRVVKPAEVEKQNDDEFEEWLKRGGMN